MYFRVRFFFFSLAQVSFHSRRTSSYMHVSVCSEQVCSGIVQSAIQFHSNAIKSCYSFYSTIYVQITNVMIKQMLKRTNRENPNTDQSLKCGLPIREISQRTLTFPCKRSCDRFSCTIALLYPHYYMHFTKINGLLGNSDSKPPLTPLDCSVYSNFYTTHIHVLARSSCLQPYIQSLALTQIQFFFIA